MKKEIKEYKNDLKKMKKIETMMKKIILNDLSNEEQENTESIIMLDLKTKILYEEQYFKIFLDELSNENLEEAEKKYNLKRVNEHLKKILKEYTQLTKELDGIIFAKEENENE